MQENTKNIQLFIVRHGQTKNNLLEIAQGTDNSENSRLTEEGKKQAKNAATQLSIEENRPIILIDNPLARVIETADEIASVLPKGSYTRICCDGLKEMDIGDLTGKPTKEVIEYFNGEKQYKSFLLDENIDPEFSFPNGEIKKQFNERVKESLEKITDKAPNQSTVIIVTHKLVASSIVSMLGYSPINIPKNGEVIKLFIKKNEKTGKITTISDKLSRKPFGMQKFLE